MFYINYIIPLKQKIKRFNEKITNNLIYLYYNLTAKFETLAVRLSLKFVVQHRSRINTTVWFSSQNSAQTGILLFWKPRLEPELLDV